MQAITVLPGEAGSARLDDLAEPPPEQGPVLVETLAVGVCGTDLEIANGEYGWAPPGHRRLVLGHESLGRVVQAPEGGGLEPGDLAVGIVRQPDPVPCESCAAGEWDMCRNGRYTEHGIKELDGFMRERYRIDPRYAVKLDPSLSRTGVLLEPTSVVAKAWEQIDRIAGRAIWRPRVALVTGAGPIGLLVALLGVQQGLEVHVLDRVTAGPKPELVADLGATCHTGAVADAGPPADVVVGVHRGRPAGVRRHGQDGPGRHRLPERCLPGRTFADDRRRGVESRARAPERCRLRDGQRQPPPLRGGRGRSRRRRPGLAGAPGQPAGRPGRLGRGAAARRVPGGRGCDTGSSSAPVVGSALRWPW
jgi:D-arabinose 1-dehydrogenase-like Zn-dependent alcohol dehydrogenase